MSDKKTIIGRQIVYLADFDEDAEFLGKSYGVTDRYSFNEEGLDKYFYGGWGKKNDYEIILLYGDTGIGKSTFALNMMRDPILKGERVGLLILEDSGASINLKLNKMIGKSNLSKFRNNIHFTPDDVVNGSKLWGLNDLLELIDEWFTERKLDVILLDHLQFAFESAIGIKGENEYVSQRVFVRKLNYLIRKHNKTIILVSHINKNNQSKGLGKIIGSGGIAGAATKAIEISRDPKIEDQMHVTLTKTRHTPSRFHDRVFMFDDKQNVVAWDSAHKKMELTGVPF
jgi:KaiC/GvpD/RAD55 family RecA-like ATPase